MVDVWIVTINALLAVAVNKFQLAIHLVSLQRHFQRVCQVYRQRTTACWFDELDVWNFEFVRGAALWQVEMENQPDHLLPERRVAKQILFAKCDQLLNYTGTWRIEACASLKTSAVAERRYYQHIADLLTLVSSLIFHRLIHFKSFQNLDKQPMLINSTFYMCRLWVCRDASKIYLCHVWKSLFLALCGVQRPFHRRRCSAHASKM